MNTFETAVAKRLALVNSASCVPARRRDERPVFIAAVSGGADSTAMLAALAVIRDRTLSETNGEDNSSGTLFSLRCLHVEHGIRPPAESRGDAAAVKVLCEKFGVPCKIVHIPQGKVVNTASKLKLGIEGAARLYRHRIWNRELRCIGAARVLVAHTKDDLLETILMRVLRGAGPAGLASIAGENGVILRPLLDLNRSDVVSYLKEKGLSCREDSTNADQRYFRNRIRHSLIPCLDSNFFFWRSSLERLGETQRFAADFISSEAQKRLSWEETDGVMRIPLELLLREKQILREESFFMAVDRLAAKARGKNRNPGKVPRRKSLRRFLVSLEDEKSPSSMDLGPVRAEKRSGYLLLKAAAKRESSSGFSLLIKENGSYNVRNSFVVKAEEPGTSFPAGEKPLFFYAAFPLVLRGEEGVFAAGQKRRFSDMIKEYKGEITAAEDRYGIAALLGTRRGKPILLFRREGESGLFRFSVEPPANGRRKL